MRNFLLCFLCVALSACADTEWPKWITGEPTSQELAAYQGPIEMPQTSTQGKVWPNLADVPARPTVILEDGAKDVLLTEMKNKNTQGLAEIENYKANNRPIIKKPSVKNSKSKTMKKKARHHG
jgi:hypothetical protein